MELVFGIRKVGRKNWKSEVNVIKVEEDLL